LPGDKACQPEKERRRIAGETNASSFAEKGFLMLPLRRARENEVLGTVKTEELGVRETDEGEVTRNNDSFYRSFPRGN